MGKRNKDFVCDPNHCETDVHMEKVRLKGPGLEGKRGDEEDGSKKSNAAAWEGKSHKDSIGKSGVVDQTDGWQDGVEENPQGIEEINMRPA